MMTIWMGLFGSHSSRSLLTSCGSLPRPSSLPAVITRSVSFISSRRLARELVEAAEYRVVERAVTVGMGR